MTDLDDRPDPLVDSWPAYIASFAIYVVLGLIVKSTVLNWIIGPLWLLITLYLAPGLWRLITRRGQPA
jgi:hypothetical protein